MRRAYVLGICAAGLLAACEEGPEQIYKPNPSTADFTRFNGWKDPGKVNPGDMPFAITSSGQKTGTTKICEADELQNRWKKMIREAILPGTGMGGLDMRGTPKWSGLTIDDAQKTLCQAYVAGEDIYFWGDNNELIAFFDTKTRIIDSLGAFPGYEGKVTAQPYEFGVNLQVQKDGKDLSDPFTDDAIKNMNIALLKAFRPEVANPDQRNCVELSTCYVRDWNTQKLLVFLDLGLYVAIEPEQQKITTIQLALQRNFDFGRGDVKFEGLPVSGLPPTPKIAYSGTCNPTLGMTWGHIKSNCLGIDPEEKALMQPVWSNEAIYADMGGLSVYMTRPTLPADQVIADGTRAVESDKIVALGFNQLYAGRLMIDRKPLCDEYWKSVAAAAQKLVPALDMTPVFAKLAPKKDTAGLTNKLTIGTQRIEDCTGSTCADATLTIRTRQLVEAEAKKLGPVPAAFKDPNFYVEILIREFLRLFNDNKAPGPSEIYLFAADETAQVLYGRLARKIGGERYAATVVYQNVSDQLLAVFFKQGALRTEDVLFKDAELSPPYDGVFRLWSLAKSPRLGLGPKPTLFPKKVMQEIQRAVINVQLDKATDVLVSYHKEDSLSGYSVPIEGKRSLFVPAAYYGFSGNVVGASIWASGKDGIKKAVSSGAFYDQLDFCGLKVGLWDPVDNLLNSLPADCSNIIGYSENGKFVTGISTYVQTTPYKIGLRLAFLAKRINGAYYWAEQ
jgi:hypothetical protein